MTSDKFKYIFLILCEHKDPVEKSEYYPCIPESQPEWINWIADKDIIKKENGWFTFKNVEDHTHFKMVWNENIRTNDLTLRVIASYMESLFDRKEHING